jgi:hypothetical protein
MGTDVFYTMDNKAFSQHLKNAIQAHKAWLNTLKNMVEKEELLPLQTDDTKCAFGHFYHAVKPQNPELLPLWNGIQEKHKRFHSYGDEAIQAILKENYDKAKEIYRQADSYSKELIDDLEKIGTLIEKLDADGKRF